MAWSPAGAAPAPAPAPTSAPASVQVAVVMGVSGSGKSTVAQAVATRLGWDFTEGDALHPAANIAKMAAGTPLTDADRAPWLGQVAAWISRELAAGRCGVVTCSALKRRYRDVLRADGVVFVHLDGSREVLLSRMTRREGHFMPASLLDSQLADLERLGPDEAAIVVDLTEPLEVQIDQVVTALAAR